MQLKKKNKLSTISCEDFNGKRNSLGVFQNKLERGLS